MSFTYKNLSQDDIDTISEFFNYVDTDKDGSISKSDIESAMSIDLNKDGVISNDERLSAGVQWFQNNFNLQDLNRNQVLSLTELLKFNDTYKSVLKPFNKP